MFMLNKNEFNMNILILTYVLLQPSLKEHDLPQYYISVSMLPLNKFHRSIYFPTALSFQALFPQKHYFSTTI